MHHRFVANDNVGYADHFASFVDDDVLNIILAIRIRDGVNLALPQVGFGVRGKTSGQGAREIVRPDRVQFVGDFVRQGTTLNRRKDSTGVSDNVSVGGEVMVMDGTLRHFSPSAAAISFERTQRLRYHSARPSRNLTPCTMPEPEEPMVLAIVDAAHKIRTIAQIAAIQL